MNSETSRRWSLSMLGGLLSGLRRKLRSLRVQRKLDALLWHLGIWSTGYRREKLRRENPRLAQILGLFDD